MIRVLVVDDQNIVRQGLRSLLEMMSDFEVVGDAENGQQALNVLAQLAQADRLPDVALMDVRMPVVDGVAATRAIAQQYPSVKVLVLTTFDDSEYVAQALRAGALGYLLKDTPMAELAESIRMVHKGYNPLGPGILQKMIAQLPANAAAKPPAALAALTPREREVLQLVARGASNAEIARELYISEGTVKFHITKILSQLGVRDRTQAAIVAHSFADWL
ncbi:response regulator transcription factor [Gloeobacter kilaueensis]|uniref:Two-component system response regulator n=1 Tax=Gloeobacter kilaueensis (strain ATCC BAA-2537 / CCAP 1431/1 / ULC 316 / JS1) TaxID=1183438 RepID=U5QFN0_GLOK1|nr:response regulator transcription factor [Gloeobacter kilaueensis]AGY56404.1 two-component system response regulator [Gloeobacter kilaueensis JS1]